MDNKNRVFLAVGALVVFSMIGAAVLLPARSEALPEVVVYKSPTCACCVKWVDHMREEGFTVETHDLNDLSEVKAQAGVTNSLASCHTALVDGYVLEGHVPADQVKRLLEERPDVRGLSVPAMPVGTPGMEMPDGRVDDYDVVAFTASGETSVYHHVEGTR